MRGISSYLCNEGHALEIDSAIKLQLSEAVFHALYLLKLALENLRISL